MVKVLLLVMVFRVWVEKGELDAEVDTKKSRNDGRRYTGGSGSRRDCGNVGWLLSNIVVDEFLWVWLWNLPNSDTNAHPNANARGSGVGLPYGGRRWRYF
jgi:hypothetical protein